MRTGRETRDRVRETNRGFSATDTAPTRSTRDSPGGRASNGASSTRATALASACGIHAACCGWLPRATRTQPTRARRSKAVTTRSSYWTGQRCAPATRISMQTTFGTAMLEPEGGVIMARRSIQALASELTRKGVRVTRGRVAKPSASRASLRSATGKRDDTRWRRIRIRVWGLAAIGIPGAPRSANHAYAASGHVLRHVRWRRSVQRVTHARMD